MPHATQPAQTRTGLLDKIASPADLRKLEPEALPALAAELRNFLIDSVSRTGGHLSSNLGTVELTIALHYVFNTPEDRIVWDVGHQTYAHKVLTGRRAGMASLRQHHGISGFPRRSESLYDTFGTAHSSTSFNLISRMYASSISASMRSARGPPPRPSKSNTTRKSPMSARIYLVTPTSKPSTIAETLTKPLPVPLTK